jgi:hypothetical protein
MCERGQARSLLGSYLPGSYDWKKIAFRGWPLSRCHRAKKELRSPHQTQGHSSHLRRRSECWTSQSRNPESRRHVCQSGHRQSRSGDICRVDSYTSNSAKERDCGRSVPTKGGYKAGCELAGCWIQLPGSWRRRDLGYKSVLLSPLSNSSHEDHSLEAAYSQSRLDEFESHFCRRGSSALR